MKFSIFGLKADFHEAKSSANSRRKKFIILIGLKYLANFFVTKKMESFLLFRDEKIRLISLVKSKQTKVRMLSRFLQRIRHEFANDFASWKSAFSQSASVDIRPLPGAWVAELLDCVVLGVRTIKRSNF